MKRGVPRAKKGRKATKAGPSQASRTRPPVPDRVSEAKSIADLVETCRAKVAKLFKPTEITYRALFEYDGDESDDLELWQCCRLAYQLLRQTHAALIPLGVAPYKSWPRERGKIATGCEAQQRWLGPAIHVIRAVIYVLVDRRPDHLGDMLPALRDLERGINDVIGTLEQVIQRCRPRAGRRVAR
jgi:hypothetical protein